MSTPNINNTVSARGLTGESASVVTTARAKGAVPETVQEPVKNPPPTPEHLKRLVESANKALDKSSAQLAFSVDDATNKSVVRVTELQSGKLIMQFPSEEMLAITRAIDQSQQGALLREKA